LLGGFWHGERIISYWGNILLRFFDLGLFKDGSNSSCAWGLIVRDGSFRGLRLLNKMIIVKEASGFWNLGLGLP
jgi:hypothetical protein